MAVFARRLTYERVPAVLMAAVDITERKRAEARITFMAHHDALTELPNRVLLRERMEEMLSRLRRNGAGLAVLCIDIDNFKTVNDTLGHPVGDLLLQARRRTRCAMHCATRILVARLGGDEFAILQTDIAQSSEVASLAAPRPRPCSPSPSTSTANRSCVGASIGIAHRAGRRRRRPTSCSRTPTWRSTAPRSDGKGTFRFFEAEMDARGREPAPTRARPARGARTRASCEVHYQPLVRLADRRGHRLRSAAALAPSASAA